MIVPVKCPERKSYVRNKNGFEHVQQISHTSPGEFWEGGLPGESNQAEEHKDGKTKKGRTARQQLFQQKSFEVKRSYYSIMLLIHRSNLIVWFRKLFQQQWTLNESNFCCRKSKTLKKSQMLTIRIPTYT